MNAYRLNGQRFYQQKRIETKTEQCKPSLRDTAFKGKWFKLYCQSISIAIFSSDWTMLYLIAIRVICTFKTTSKCPKHGLNKGAVKFYYIAYRIISHRQCLTMLHYHPKGVKNIPSDMKSSATLCSGKRSISVTT